MELQQKVVRETGNLSKMANMRKETLQNLVKHRLMAKEERRMLADEKKVLKINNYATAQYSNIIPVVAHSIKLQSGHGS